MNEVVFFEELLESEGTLVQDPVDVGGHGQASHAPEHAPEVELRPSGMSVVQLEGPEGWKRTRKKDKKTRF